MLPPSPSMRENFYPRPPRGGRRGPTTLARSLEDFYPRPPRGGRRFHPAGPHCVTSNFYPRPPRGGRQRKGWCKENMNRISIHALREEGDCCHTGMAFILLGFLSTPSARRATHATQKFTMQKLKFLSTPSARRATFSGALNGYTPKNISIHALREEGDAGLHMLHIMTQTFLSTPSARRATSGRQLFNWGQTISIHALREEGDAYPLQQIFC